MKKLLQMFCRIPFVNLLLLDNGRGEELSFCCQSEEETEKLLVDATPKNTRKATDMWVSAFHSFCSAEEENLDVATCSK